MLGSRKFSTCARWAGRVETVALVWKMSECGAAAVSVSVESSTAGEHLEDEQGRCVNGSMDGDICLEGEDACVQVGVCLGLGESWSCDTPLLQKRLSVI